MLVVRSWLLVAGRWFYKWSLIFPANNPQQMTSNQQPETFLYFALKYKETGNDG